MVSIGKLSAMGKAALNFQRNSGLMAKSEFSFMASNTKIVVVVEMRDGQVPVMVISDASVTQT